MASPDQNLIGYHVYKSDDEFGVFQRISGSTPVDTTYFEDLNYQLGDWYMVRAVAEQLSGSGVFLHPSQGIFVQGQIMVANETSVRESFVVSPNPATDVLNLTLKRDYDQVEIWSIDGRLLMRERVTDAFGSLELDVSDLQGGTYLVRLLADEEWVEKRFVKL